MKVNKLIYAGIASILLLLLVHYPSSYMTAAYTKLAKNTLGQILVFPVNQLNKDELVGPKTVNNESESATKATSSNLDESLLMCTKLSSTQTISGCFLKGGKQLAIIRFEVSWDASIVNPTSGDATDAITVKIGDKSRVINPGKFPGGDVKAPYPVAFELPADGSTVTAQIFTGADFAGSTCAIEITGLALPTNTGCTSGSGSGGGGGLSTEFPCEFGQLGGIVWFDNNSDGEYQASEVDGAGSVKVEAYNSTGVLIDTAVTSTNGRYLMTGIDSSEYPVRLQFRNLPKGSVFPYRSDVQFVYSPNCMVNFPVYVRASSSIGVDTSGPGIPIATTCYVEGDQNSAASPEDVLVASTTKFATPTILAKKDEVGSTWGLAHNSKKNVLFSAAFLKRHNGLGPLGLGGIYQTNLNGTSPGSSTFIDLDPFVNLGTIGQFGKTGNRKYKDSNNNNVFDPGEPSWDQEAFAKVGKVGLGDIEISEDNNTLYAVNLFQRKIIAIDITAINNKGTLPTGTNISTLPDYLPVNCGNASSRPFALKVKDGKLYLGLVCDGFPAYAQVQSFDFSTQIWNVELPLTNISYKRTPQAGTPGWPDGMFREWVDVFSTITIDQGGFIFQTNTQNHSAILSDIEFDASGNMILGFIDRGGHQFAADNYAPDTTNTKFYAIYSAGELLMAHKTSTGGYVIEVNPESNSTEFFKDAAYHPESSNGGVAYDAVSNSVIFSAMDPITFFSGGLSKVDATTGKKIAGLTLYAGRSNNGYAGKGAGIGDVELLVSAPSPPPPFLQIGNYAWVDIDADGVQGPQEISLPGLDVSLYKKVGANFVFVAYTQTDGSGSYAFTGLGAPNEYWVSTSGVDSLRPGMEYKIVFGYNGQASTSQVSGTNIIIGGITHTLTTPNTGEGVSSDMNDSDATFMNIAGGSYPSINVTTGTDGIDHSFDVGFTSEGYEGIGNLVWFDANFDGEQDPGEPGVQGVKVNLHPCIDTIPGAPIASFMRTTDEFGRYIMTNVPLGNYSLSFDYSMVTGSDTLRFTIPDINFNLQKLNDSEVLIPSDYYTQSTPVEIRYSGCFHWDPAEGNGFDPSFDAGLMSQDELIDPTGYVYCEGNGEILSGGLLTVTGPGNVYLIHDASQGYYQYYVDAVGVYTMTLTNPPGYVSSELCIPSPIPLDAPDSVQIYNPYSIGSDDLNKDGFLDNYTCPQNRLYTQMFLEPGDFIINNNFPMACSDLGDLPSPYPTLNEDDGPRHAILRNPLVYMGSIVDIELDGQPDTMAGIMGGGDDGVIPNVDDEDGLLTPTVFVVTVPNEVRVQVNNKSTSTAKLTVFADLNKDGDFDDTGEMESESVNAGYMGPVSVYFTPDLDAPIGEKSGLRLRLTTDNVMTPTASAVDGEIEDYMFTFAGFDYGDLPESYNTSGTDNPPAHVVSESLKLGASVDGESDGIADAMAGSMGAGDDGDGGLITFGTSTPSGDDEDGVMLASPLIPGGVSSFMVTAMNMTTSSAVLQAWVDFNGNGSFETAEQLTSGSFAPSGSVVPVGGLNGAKLTFNVPSNAVFYSGNAMVRFRLSPNGGLSGSSQVGSPPIGEIEDYKFPLAKVGNLVWEDYNHNGLQDTGEPGIDSVMVSLIWAGPDGDITTQGDNATYMTKTGPAGGYAAGEYNFCGLTAGDYKLIFSTPAHMLPTQPNRGTQSQGGILDSDPAVGTDFNITMSMFNFTLDCAPCQPLQEDGFGDNAPGQLNGFPDIQTDETFDVGFWRPCCSDLLNYCCPQNQNRKE